MYDRQDTQFYGRHTVSAAIKHHVHTFVFSESQHDYGASQTSPRQCVARNVNWGGGSPPLPHPSPPLSSPFNGGPDPRKNFFKLKVLVGEF